MVTYEWIRETCDSDGDIINVDHFDQQPDAKEGTEVALVRDDWHDGMSDRLWAYADADGTLPTHFSDSAGAQTSIRVPKRFLK